jgi:hypothetical protein
MGPIFTSSRTPVQSAMTASIPDFIDLERYPIADLAMPDARALVADAKAKLRDPGYFTMPGFIRAEALSAIADEARAHLDGGHWHERLRDAGIGLDTGNYPWHRPTRAAVRCAGGDRMAPVSPLRLVYEWQPLIDFLGTVFGVMPYYRSEDLMVGCMLTGYAAGDELGWHFDPNDGVVTLMLQKAGAGGIFEFAPKVRTTDNDRAENVYNAVMDGRWPGTVREDQEPGTLALFNGHRSLHRVTPVEAAPDRLVLVMSYDSQPGQVFSDDIRQNFFGRTS